MQTVWSRAEAARGRGYEYTAITDHAGGLKIANRLDAVRLAVRARRLPIRTSARTIFAFLRSVEANLSLDGSVDVGDTAELDLELACAVGCRISLATDAHAPNQL